jgi:hypothetical protein
MRDLRMHLRFFGSLERGRQGAGSHPGHSNLGGKMIFPGDGEYSTTEQML